MYCCYKCFGDLGLAKIITYLTKRAGKCDYCGSEGIALIEPAELMVKFEPLLDCYDHDPKGKPLTHWLREDWFLFTNEKLDEAQALRLLADILGDEGAAAQPRVPSDSYTTNRLGDWDKFREELIHEN